MNAMQSPLIRQRWRIVQEELGKLTPRLKKQIHILDGVRIEEFVPDGVAFSLAGA
jgi:hypothetical protein